MAELKRVYDLVPPLWGEGSSRPDGADEVVRRDLRRPFSFVCGQAGSTIEAKHVEVRYDDELTSPDRLDKEIVGVFEAYGHQAVPRGEPGAAAPLVADDPEVSVTSYRFSLPVVSADGMLDIEQITKVLRDAIVDNRDSIVDCKIYANGMDVIHRLAIDRKDLHKYVRKTVSRILKRQPSLFPGHSLERPAHVHAR